VILAKNPAGWSEVLGYLGGRDTGVVIAVNAHLADGRDPSWLWDVPFELLRGMPVAASGERALDVAVRLKYGGVECIVERDPTRAAQRIAGADVHMVASYTQFMALARKYGDVQ
jgi:UDP-N-acetylmuramyl tripeptide synthase